MAGSVGSSGWRRARAPTGEGDRNDDVLHHRVVMVCGVGAGGADAGGGVFVRRLRSVGRRGVVGGVRWRRYHDRSTGRRSRPGRHPQPAARALLPRGDRLRARRPTGCEIFTELVEAADCPDLVGLQEIGARLEELLPPAVATLCDGEYTIAWRPASSPDREMVLTRLPVLEQGYLDIANFPWEAYWVRVDSAQGPVDFLTTHFASSSNNPPCAPELCPPVCPTGITTNECHAAEVVEFFEDGRRGP